MEIYKIIYIIYHIVVVHGTALCPPGAVWNDCGSCNPTCDFKDRNCPEWCRNGGCVCPTKKPIEDYDIDGNMRCIDIKECCPRPKVFNPCGSACPPKCNQPLESQLCTQQCVPGCTCPRNKPFEIKTEDGFKCISRDECSPSKCPGDLIWNGCGSACTRSCYDPNPICTLQCVPRCECPHSTPIQVKGNMCIKEKMCVCKNKSGWKATVKVGGVPCKRCSCQKLKNKGLSYLKKACENNIRNARRNCCKLCKANGYPYQNW